MSNPMTSLVGKSVLVVGATGGLGAPISRRLADAGALLTLVGRDESRLAELGVPGAFVAVDLLEPASAAAATDGALAAHGRLDGLVVASGVVAFGPVSEVNAKDLADLFAINVLGPIRLLQAALPHLRASAGASRNPFVVNLSAVVAESPTAGMAAYSASKAALSAFDSAAARELRREGIRLIDARPPHTETGLANRPLAGTPPKLPQGLEPISVARRIVDAIENGERDLPSTAFLT